MAGNIMRTPIIQKEIMSIWNEQIPISKGILIDECTSVGAALYGYYSHFGKLNMDSFNKIYEFNNYEVYCNLNNYSDTNIIQLIRRVGCEDIQKDDEMCFNVNSELTLDYYYNQNETKYFSNHNYLYKYVLNINELKRIDDQIEMNKYSLNHNFINNNMTFKFSSFYELVENQKTKRKVKTIDNPEKFIQLIEGGIYLPKDNNERIINKLKQKVEEHNLFDKNHYDYSIDRNNLTKKIYKHKENIQKTIIEKEKKEKYLKKIIDFEKKVREIENLKVSVDEKKKQLNQTKNELEVFEEELNTEFKEQKKIEKEKREKELNEKKEKIKEEIINYLKKEKEKYEDKKKYEHPKNEDSEIIENSEDNDEENNLQKKLNDETKEIKNKIAQEKKNNELTRIITPNGNNNNEEKKEEQENNNSEKKEEEKKNEIEYSIIIEDKENIINIIEDFEKKIIKKIDDLKEINKLDEIKINYPKKIEETINNHKMKNFKEKIDNLIRDEKNKKNSKYLEILKNLKKNTNNFEDLEKANNQLESIALLLEKENKQNNLK